MLHNLMYFPPPPNGDDQWSVLSWNDPEEFGHIKALDFFNC